MTDRDIALLLADAADGVEVGIAPTQAVIRGGRRRRARRWAVATATALAIVGSTATLALAGLPGDGHQVAPAVTQRPTPTPAAFQDAPHRTTLATGTDQGTKWKVFIDVWGAPRDEAEAQAQLTAMAEYEESAPDVRKASDLIGKVAYFVYRGYGDTTSPVLENTVVASDAMADTDLTSGALPLVPGADNPVRLGIGSVSKTAERVLCHIKDGDGISLTKAPTSDATDNVEPAIRSAEGSPYNWFVCVAPKGTEFESAEVTALS
ncbi:hypothetical protein ACIQI8_12840 [Streptomyces sp. NPDC092369]|uniref:hypothetical protein n=1 Tax=Streptomyces sp. NPDC092369 TaxID=3366015 RepID=UPI00381B3DA5